MFVYQIHIASSEEPLWEERLTLAEPATQVFSRIDAQTISIEATFPNDLFPKILQAAFGGALKPLIATGLTDGWEPLPAKIGSTFLVADPDTQPPDSDRTVLQMNTGEGVFVGHRHPTTLACLRMMHHLHDEGRLTARFRCLDVGCGSGLLGIAAGFLGAGEINGFDFCETSIAAARVNAAHHEVTLASWQCTEIEKFVTTQSYDLIVANLFSDLLVSSFASLRNWLAPNGDLIVSGILQRFKETVFEAAQLAGLTVVETRQRGPWIAGLLTSSDH
ncbi:MAG: methyltransferase domain-containing protein [Verrucomicrobiaceae bacterium]|nr:methyltransferase domain-containing protein [Verrucomicrobiaceae bacterium]